MGTTGKTFDVIPPVPNMPVQKIKFHVAQKKFHPRLLPQAKNFEDIFTPGDLEAIW